MSKSCELIQDIIPLYVDGVCSEESTKLVEEHIANCETCRKEVEKLKSNIAIPLNTDTSDVKGLKKYVQKKIWLKTIAIVAVLAVILIVANWVISTRFSEIWPKADAEGLQEYLEVVDLNGEFYLHQSDLFGFGEIILLSTDEELEQGIIKFYLGEQGLNTLDPSGRARMWMMNEKYARIPGIMVDENMDDELVESGLNKDDVTEIVYCHKNGEEVVTLWETGDALSVYGQN